MTTRHLAVEDLRGRLTLGVDEAGQILGISRATAYQAAREGRIPSLQLGTQRRVVPAHRFLTETLGLPADTAAQILGLPAPDNSRAAPGEEAATTDAHPHSNGSEHTHHALPHSA